MESFAHIKTVLGIILGLGLTHLLKGATKLVVHPGRAKGYWVHLLWALYVFIITIHFWWFEVYLESIKGWVFATYVFLVFYITLYYILSALLFPDDLNEYKGYEDYFYSRRKWFFGVLALVFAADIVDSLLKGKAYMAHLHWEYPVRNAIHIILCLAAIKISSKRFHAALVIVFLLYDLWWIGRLYYR
jgi:hypothetical protein